MDSQVYDARTRALDVPAGRQLASASSLVGHFETVSSAAKQSATLNLHVRQEHAQILLVLVGIISYQTVLSVLHQK